MSELLTHFKKNPLMAACNLDNMEEAAGSRASIILLMKCSLNQLIKPDFPGKCGDKPLFLHADMIKGLSGDRESIRFLRDFIRPAGLVSTRGNLIRNAKKEGFTVIQRVFLIDHSSLENSLESIRDNKPDGVELMPGIALDIIERVRGEIDCPLIASGLISERKQVVNALNRGVQAVSMSRSELWHEDFSHMA